VIVNTSSILIKKGFSVSLTGVSIHESTASINSSIAATYLGSPSRAFNADPLMIGVLSPSNPYSESNSLTSISTKSSSSGSSTISHLLMNTTILGTPTCLDNRMCSLV